MHSGTHARSAPCRGRAPRPDTTKKSMETRSLLWFWRNARKVCDGGFRRSGMYRDTVASPTSKPSLSIAVNARRSPSRVLAGDSTDERPDLRIDRWTSASVSALPGRVEPEALAMPADHGLGLHDDQGVLPVRQQTRERDPECAVRFLQLGAFGLALHNGQLLSQGEVLESEFALRPEARSGGRAQGVQQGSHRNRLA